MSDLENKKSGGSSKETSLQFEGKERKEGCISVINQTGIGRRVV